MEKLYYCYPYGTGPDFKHCVMVVDDKDVKDIQESWKYLPVGQHGFFTKDIAEVIKYLR